MNLEVERYEGELRELRKAAQMALKELERYEGGDLYDRDEQLIQALRQVLAKSEEVSR